jgi:hypothetical protein
MEGWFYRVETDEYVYASIDNYKFGMETKPEHFKHVIPGQIIKGLAEMLESNGVIHEKDRSEDLKIINRLIDTVQMGIQKS